MGLTMSSTGAHAKDEVLTVRRDSPDTRILALAGNPNVGKSTVFNELTGLRQHTGNWPGKTVAGAQGRCTHRGREYILVDVPGSYSLLAQSAEEEAARDFICFGGADAVIVVCDATCLERNLNLVLQILEITSNAVVCVNLMDEARRKHISVDVKTLEMRLGVPVTATSARAGEGLPQLMDAAERAVSKSGLSFVVRYPEAIENAINTLEMPLGNMLLGRLNERWAAIRLLEGDDRLISLMEDYAGLPLLNSPQLQPALEKARGLMLAAGYDASSFRDALVSSVYKAAEELCRGVVIMGAEYSPGQLRADRLLTRKSTGIPVMLLLLALVFYITIAGANYPSQWLSAGFEKLRELLSSLLLSLGTPSWLQNSLIDGVYRVLAWVVAVMLPPMAIFFPLFTLLEDLGYLPRVAFNLDNCFRKCRACGKQALTMCMGFGCNAAGVVGCRIIGSPRERLIAVITNAFVPCNGRFPTLIAIITMFFVSGDRVGSPAAALMLTALIVFSVLATFGVSYLLSKTLLRGLPSSLTLEMPPYRRPQLGKVILRSVTDRTLFVLGRAAAVAAPAGLLIWICANVQVGGVSLLAHCTGFLDPFARLFGLDGVILTAFILGLPANEIVLPIILMAYTASGTLMEYDSLASLRTLLADNGWTWLTAICTMLFSLMHWPCATTLMTIKKETGSLKWTLVSALVPTLCGFALCFLVTAAARLLS